MKIETFEMERMQSTWENLVEYDMSESGIRAVSLNELAELGFDLKGIMDMPLGYSQSNGTIELREELAKIYPGTTIDNIEVSNGTSEANYLLCLALLKQDDEVAFEIPNYMQLWGVSRSLGAKVNKFSLDFEKNWEPNWKEFEAAVNEKTRLVYVTNPNNPTGSILSQEAMQRIVKRCEEMGAYLISDEVYIGAELEQEQTKSFWGMSDRVIVTSGLSKAYGIPGVRIGWIVGNKDLVHECWTQHDYITIGPNKISDMIARTAVKQENRNALYARTKKILKSNFPVMLDWLQSFNDFFTFHPPKGGAFCFPKYKPDIPSYEICKAILENQDTLITPGRHFGLEGFLRIWIGAKPEFMKEGLRRIGEEIRKIM